jgi:hypothetical protein
VLPCPFTVTVAGPVASGVGVLPCAFAIVNVPNSAVQTRTPIIEPIAILDRTLPRSAFIRSS